MNKKGMTLLELVVYMVLAFLVLAPIIMLMTNSSKTMARDATVTDMHMSGQDILNIIYNDLKNTGFKLNLDADLAVVDSASYSDNSSIDPYDDNAGDKSRDSLIVLMGRINSDKRWCGVQEVSYFIRDDSLIRRAKDITTVNILNVDCATDFPMGERVIAQNVVALQFEYSYNQTVWIDEPGLGPCTSPITFDTNPGTDPNGCDTKFIKASIVLRDTKRLSPTRTNAPIEVANATITREDPEWLYETHSIVIPIPNNGLFPPLP